MNDGLSKDNKPKPGPDLEELKGGLDDLRAEISELPKADEVSALRLAQLEIVKTVDRLVLAFDNFRQRLIGRFPDLASLICKKCNRTVTSKDKKTCSYCGAKQ